MNDTIVQEVRDIRAAIAAEFGYDRKKFIAWAREQTKQRKALGNTSPDKNEAALPPVAQKRRVRPARVSA